VFRIEATLKSLPFKGEPYYMARINTLRISAVDPDAEEDEWGLNGDPVFVRFAGLDVTTYSYTGRPFAIERGPLDYYLSDSGNYSDFHMAGENGKEPVTKTFYVPVRFDGDLQAGYELRFQFGGTYYEYFSGAQTKNDHKQAPARKRQDLQLQGNHLVLLSARKLMIDHGRANSSLYSWEGVKVAMSV